MSCISTFYLLSRRWWTSCVSTWTKSWKEIRSCRSWTTGPTLCRPEPRSSRAAPQNSRTSTGGKTARWVCFPSCIRRLVSQCNSRLFLAMNQMHPHVSKSHLISGDYFSYPRLKVSCLQNNSCMIVEIWQHCCQIPQTQQPLLCDTVRASRVL